MRGKSLVMEALTAGFYVNVTRSLAPIYLAVVGYDVIEIVKLNAKAYLFATILAYVIYRYRNVLLKSTKSYLITFHALERVFWGLIPLSYYLNVLPAFYTLAICFTVPTSALINVAIFSLDERSAKKTLALRNSFGAFSNILGSITSLIVLYTLEGYEKYTYLYALASAVGFTSTIVLLFADIGSLELKDVEEELKIKSVNVLLFLLLVTSSSAIIGSTWMPHLVRDLKVEDHFAMLVSFIQTTTSIFAPLFWAGKSYKTYRFAVILASTVPFLIYTVEFPILHLIIAVVYTIAFSGTNMLASFICAEIKGTEVPFLLTAVTTLSQLFGMVVAIAVGTFHSMMVSASLLLLSALILSLLAIPEISIDVEKARIYSKIVYNITLSGYSFSTTLARETTLLAIRLTVVSLSVILIIFIYRVAYYLSL